MAYDYTTAMGGIFFIKSNCWGKIIISWKNINPCSGPPCVFQPTPAPQQLMLVLVNQYFSLMFNFLAVTTRADCDGNLYQGKVKSDNLSPSLSLRDTEFVYHLP